VKRSEAFSEYYDLAVSFVCASDSAGQSPTLCTLQIHLLTYLFLSLHLIIMQFLSSACIWMPRHCIVSVDTQRFWL